MLSGHLFSQVLIGDVLGFQQVGYFPSEVIGDGFFEVGEGGDGVGDLVFFKVPIVSFGGDEVFYIGFFEVPKGIIDLGAVSCFVYFDDILIALCGVVFF